MATGPRSPGGTPAQPRRTGQGDGAYFEGEGHQPFEERAGDPDSREAEAVVDDLISEFTGGGTPTPGSHASGTVATPPAHGTAAGTTAPAAPEGSAGASGTSRGSASRAPGAGRMG